MLKTVLVVDDNNSNLTLAEEALEGITGITIAKILHPSPASPKSNSDWGGEVMRQLKALGIWESK